MIFCCIIPGVHFTRDKKSDDEKTDRSKFFSHVKIYVYLNDAFFGNIEGSMLAVLV